MEIGDRINILPWEELKEKYGFRLCEGDYECINTDPILISRYKYNNLVIQGVTETCYITTNGAIPKEVVIPAEPRYTVSEADLIDVVEQAIHDTPIDEIRTTFPSDIGGAILTSSRQTSTRIEPVRGGGYTGTAYTIGHDPATATGTGNTSTTYTRPATTAESFRAGPGLFEHLRSENIRPVHLGEVPDLQPGQRLQDLTERVNDRIGELEEDLQLRDAEADREIRQREAERTIREWTARIHNVNESLNVDEGEE